MKITILLCIAILLAGVLLTPTEAIAHDDGPTISRATVSDSPRMFELDDGSTTTLDRRVIIVGSGFFGTAHGPFVRFVDEQNESVDAVVVILRDETRIEAWPPKGTRGPRMLVVENPDRRLASTSIEF